MEVILRDRTDRTDRTDPSDQPYSFTVRTRASHGPPPPEAKNGTKLARGANFRCVLSGAPIPDDYIKAESMAGRMGARLMAIVAEGERGRVYLPPTPEHEAAARQAKPAWKPDEPMNRDTKDLVSGRGYGFFTWADLFTPRQLVALTTFSDLVGEAIERVKRDAMEARSEGREVRSEGREVRSENDPFSSHSSDLTPLADGGTGAAAYAEAVGVYLAFAVDRCADFGNSVTQWVPSNQKVMHLFGKQAIAITWDFPEAAILQDTVGGFYPAAEFIADCILKLPADPSPSYAYQSDAQSQTLTTRKVVSTDPPYYDNIGYADLSDFFYVWLRRSLRPVFPDLFSTLAVPKAEELVATPYRHGSKEKAEAFFLDGMTQAMRRLAEQAHPAFPVTIYYAFKQQEVREEKREKSDALDPESHSSLLSPHFSTGWETFLAAVIEAGFSITGTWPMRSEQKYRMIGMDTNALASSIVLVCRPRPADAPIATRREFLAALKAELPAAIRTLQGLPPRESSHSSLLSTRSSIAPVDLAQAAIGPGMAVYTRYAKVLDAEGRPLAVREALALINATLDEVLAEQEGDFDADTRWALAWFEQHGFAEGEYGVAETLSKAKNTSVAGMVEAGIVASARGKVRLLKPDELPADWEPARDPRLTVWEAVHHLIRALESGGEGAAAQLVAKLGSTAETARELAYRLYTLCERKKRAAEALSYNGLVQSWPEITRLARAGAPPGAQAPLFGEAED